MASSTVTQIFSSIDNVTTEFVATNLSNVIAFVTPWIALGLTIALMAEGVSIMARPNGDPLAGLVTKFIRYAVIISIASAGGLYQTQIASTALSLPDKFANVLVLNGSSNQSDHQTASVIDNALDDGMKTAKRAFEAGGWSSWSPYFLGAAVLVVTVLMCALGAGLILMAKFMLAITVCFGPIFIFALLFRGTEALFGKWMGSLINYMLLTVLLAAVFGLMMSFFAKTISVAAHGSGEYSLLPLTISTALISAVSWFVMKAVPGIASSWGAGITAAASGFSSSAVGRAGKGAMGGAAGGAGGGAMGAAKGAVAGASGGGGAMGAAKGAAGGGAKGAVGGAMKGMARGSRK